MNFKISFLMFFAVFLSAKKFENEVFHVFRNFFPSF